LLEEYRLAGTKTEFLNMRVKPQTKRALKFIAELEKRSMANAFEWLVDEYLERKGLPVPKLSTKRLSKPVGVQQ
jgi:hypothetical protein